MADAYFADGSRLCLAYRPGNILAIQHDGRIFQANLAGDKVTTILMRKGEDELQIQARLAPNEIFLPDMSCLFHISSNTLELYAGDPQTRVFKEGEG